MKPGPTARAALVLVAFLAVFTVVDRMSAPVRRVPSGADIRSTTVNTARNASNTNAARAVGPGFSGPP